MAENSIRIEQYNMRPGCGERGSEKLGQKLFADCVFPKVEG